MKTAIIDSERSDNPDTFPALYRGDLSGSVFLIQKISDLSDKDLGFHPDFKYVRTSIVEGRGVSAARHLSSGAIGQVSIIRDLTNHTRISGKMTIEITT